MVPNFCLRHICLKIGMEFPGLYGVRSGKNPWGTVGLEIDFISAAFNVEQAVGVGQ